MNTKSDSALQANRFRKAARELCADEREDRFRDQLRRIAKHKPRERAPDPDAKATDESRDKPGQ